MERLHEWKCNFDDFDGEKWSSFLQSINENINKVDNADPICTYCKLSSRNLCEVGFIYKLHKFDRGYGDTFVLCPCCLYAIDHKIIPNPSDYDYVGILKNKGDQYYTYEVDGNYYLKNQAKDANSYLSFYTNVHWDELSKEEKDQLQEYREELNDFDFF